MAQTLSPDEFFNGSGASAAGTLSPEQFFNAQPKDFWGREGEDLSKRWNEVKEIKAAEESGQQGQTHSALQVAGTGFGALTDLLGNAVGSLVREAAPPVPTPDSIKKPVQQVGSAIANSQVGQAVGDVFQAGAEGAQQFAQQYPVAARDIKAVGNIVGGLPFVKPVQGIASSAGRAAIDAAEGAAKYTAGGAKNLATGIKARTAEELTDEVGALKSDAIATKNRADLSNAKLEPEETQNLLNNMETALQGVKLIPEFTPKTNAVIRIIKEDAEKGTLSLNDIDQYRRLLGGARAEDSVAAVHVRKAIDATLNGLKTEGRTADSIKLLNDFRKEYSQASKFEDITDIVKSTDGNPNKLKAKLTKYANDEGNLRGWSDEEKLLLKTAANSSFPEKVLRGLGTFGFDIGKAKNIALPAIASGGALLAPTVAAPLVAGGTVARQAGKYIAQGKVENLLRGLQQTGKLNPAEVAKLSPEQGKDLFHRIQQIKIRIE